MKNNLVNFLLLMIISISACAQNSSKEITIYYFKELNKEDVSKIIDLKNNLSKKNKKTKYSINLKNFYNDIVTKFDKENDLFYLPQNIINGQYNNNQEVINKLNSITASNKITYSTNLYPLYKTDELCSNIDDLIKKIKKIKTGGILIIWLNDFLPNKYSTENVKKIFNQSIENGTISILKPKIIHPKIYEKIIPDEKYYYIRFEPVEYFNKYQILITFYDYKENKSKEIFNKILDVTNKNDVDNFSIEKINNVDNQVQLKIAAYYIALECYKLKKELSPDDVPDEEDCGGCKYECLYNKEFSIKIRGYNDNFTSDELWSEKIFPFFFQCPR